MRNVENNEGIHCTDFQRRNVKIFLYQISRSSSSRVPAATCRLIVNAYSLDVPTRTARCLSRHNNARDPSSKRWNYWERNGRQILAESSDFHDFFRDLLHATNLRYGTDGFTSTPKEGVPRIFTPANLGTKGQHHTSRPPQPPNFT